MDNYEIVKQLGKGGLGIAYAVRKTNTFAPSGFLVLKKVACRSQPNPCSTSAEGNAALREAQMYDHISPTALTFALCPFIFQPRPHDACRRPFRTRMSATSCRSALSSSIHLDHAVELGVDRHWPSEQQGIA
eukprot:932875-Rhodomonas_salina.1